MALDDFSWELLMFEMKPWVLKGLQPLDDFESKFKLSLTLIFEFSIEARVFRLDSELSKIASKSSALIGLLIVFLFSKFFSTSSKVLVLESNGVKLSFSTNGSFGVFVFQKQFWVSFVGVLITFESF